MLIILNMMSEKPTSILYMCKTLGLSDRTLYRKIEDLRMLGVEFDNQFNFKYRIIAIPEWLKNASESLAKQPLNTPKTHLHEYRNS